SVAIESKGSKRANTPRDVCTGHKSTKGTTALTSSNNQFSLAIAAPKIAAAPISNMMKLNFASQCQYCKFFIFVSIGIDLRPPWRLLKSANQYIDWKAIDTFIQLMLRRAAPVSEHGLLITIIRHRMNWSSAGVDQIPVDMKQFLLFRLPVIGFQNCIAAI